MTAIEKLSTKTLENPRDKTQLVAAIRPVISAKHAGYDLLLAGE